MAKDAPGVRRSRAASATKSVFFIVFPREELGGADHGQGGYEMTAQRFTTTYTLRFLAEEDRDFIGAVSIAQRETIRQSRIIETDIAP